MQNNGSLPLLVYSHDQVMQNNGSTISSSHFKSSSEFLLLHFQRTHQSSAYYYTFASHTCNLDFWFIYNLLLSFDYFQVTIQHDTIEVHEYCWDSLKGSPRLLLFSVIRWSKLKHTFFRYFQFYITVGQK